MQLLRLPLALAVVVLMGACAPTTPVTAPSPEPAPTAMPAPATDPSTPAVDPEVDPVGQPDGDDVAPSGAPARWWLADADAAGPGAVVERAYRELLAGRQPKRTVVVGVIDSGVEIGHEDLDDNLWVNADEVPGNGIDDDGNGYVDDIHGWNFIGGPDGRHVNQDTYEVTRLYARCRAGRGLPADGAAVAATCPVVEAEFEEDRREAEQQLVQIESIATAVDRMVEILREATGSDPLVMEEVRALTPLRMDVRQAQMMYLQLAELGITPEMVTQERQRLADRLAYGLNPDFDPREVVGDDFEDATERVYGNADVTGPRAGHGTGVAGIIGAERDNDIGEDGIASSVRIMVLRAVPDGDERDKDVANAIRYAVDNGAHIINMSFGKAHSPRKSAVDAAVRHAEERGVLLVHAAGNAGADLAVEPSYPTRTYLDGGEASNWLEVGASNWEGSDRLAAPFSNYGRGQVDVFAPGVDIRTTDVDNDFQISSGTSFAAPMVAGLAALIMAYYPELDAGQVRRVILESATPFRAAQVARPGTGPGSGPDAGPDAVAELIPFGDLSITGGIVNAYEALRRAEELTRAGG